MAGVRRRGKQFLIEVAAGPVVVVHLMSAGRLQLYDKRAGPRDRTSRLLVRLEGERELRLREFGTRQAAWVKPLGPEAVDDEESLATLGPEAWPDPPELGELAVRRAAHGFAARSARDRGIGRSWVDEILWTARLSPFKRGDALDGRGRRAAQRDRGCWTAP